MNARSLLAMALLAPLGLALTLGVRVEPDKENVTQGRLTGVWVMDAELCKRLGIPLEDTKIEFTPDESFLDALPSKYDEFLKTKQIFEAGRITYRRGGKPSSYPYLLTTHAGNPYLFYFRERDGEPLGDAESFKLMAIPGKERAKDLLFVGEDLGNSAFRPYRRQGEPKDTGK